MNKTTRIVVTVLLFTLGACAVSRVGPLSIPLVYTTSPKNAGAIGSMSCNSIAAVPVTDARSDKILGERKHESKPLHAEVTAASDPAAWVQSGVQGLLGQSGMIFGGKGPILALSLDSLQTSESIWHRASYSANIALTATLRSAAGKVCLTQTVQGEGGNYGYAGSIVNYQQTLNAALDNATTRLAQTSTFKQAVCQCAE
jgi:hypothetical protein